MVRFILSSVGSAVNLDRRCPHCRRNHGRIHSGLQGRRIVDLRTPVVLQRRMRCPDCGMTWTLRAEGVGAGRQRSDRIRGIGIVLYMLGLSYRSVATFLPCLDCTGSKSSIERDVTEAGQRAAALHRSAPKARVRVLGVDGTGDAMAGTKGGVLFFVDVDQKRLLCVEPIQETDARRLRQHVRQVFAEVGATELRTDEHSVYEGIVPPGRHRLCETHWRKSKGKRAWDLWQEARQTERDLEADSMQTLLDLLRQKPRPPTPPPELEVLVRRYINARRGLPGRINRLLQHVERTWEHVSDDPFDATNNATERTIGLDLKIRSKTMRGFKNKTKVLNHTYLSHLLRGGPTKQCDLRQIT